MYLRSTVPNAQSQSRYAPSARSSREQSSFGFSLYLVLVVSWFLRIPARVEILGILRVDLLLIATLSIIAFNQRTTLGSSRSAIDRWLTALVVYSLLALPLVEWPGSAVKIGFPNFLKAAVFYYFTRAFIRSEKQLRTFMMVFLSCQIFRVLEPLYLNLTVGYWGSRASLGGGVEFMNRLAGGPFDVVNPNGLAFIVCTVLPLLYFLSQESTTRKIVASLLSIPLLYALLLSGSRSGMIGLLIVALGIIIKSKHKTAIVATFSVATILGLGMLSGDMSDRYLSILGKSEKNQATASERWEGMRSQLQVVYRRPFFGYGLGTSAEANHHYSLSGPYAGKTMPAHNIYLEVAQELGLFGLIIFLGFLYRLLQGFLAFSTRFSSSESSRYTAQLVSAMQVWIAMSLVFSLASYGLSNYDWYLFAGLAAVLGRSAPPLAESFAQERSLVKRR